MTRGSRDIFIGGYMVNETLNSYLADLVVMYLKLHDLHWKVKGKLFVQVHMYTEARYNDLAEKFDEVAEKIIMNGGVPATGIKNYSSLSAITELNKDRYSDEEALKEVQKDFEYLKKQAGDIRSSFGEQDMFSIVNMLENHIETYEKEIWFLKSMEL